ncbi:surface antigen-domain-containing protein [Choanephora cucurbitarum]|nr:surface antigen-domain-containing protein [Choanephora cucurbitarum]
MSNTTETPLPKNVPAEAPLRVNTLRILGTNITRHSFLNSVTNTVFGANTTEEVMQQVQAMANQLQKHDIFEEIKVYLDTNREVTDTVDVTLHLKEKDKGLFETNINVGNNQAELNGGVGLRNVFGGAESLLASFSFGNRTRAAVEGAFETPFRGSANAKVGLFVNGSIRDYSQINAFKESSKTTGIRFKGLTTFGRHELAYAVTHKDLLALSKASSLVRTHSGDHKKHAVLHSFIRDHRDSVTLPTEGHYIGIFQELAGLGGKGDASFLKHELNASVHQPLTSDKLVVFSSSVRAGLISTMNEPKEIPLTDRFYLGGPLSVRGFKMGGIGEREGNDAVGGEAYWAAGASLVARLPGSDHVKAHAFANAGSIVTQAQGVPLGETIKTLSETSRSSVGFGLIFHHPIARIEANYCIPVRYSATDLPEPKLQFGFGVNFL